MPPLLKELYPDMYEEEYEISKGQDLFLSKKIKVCDTCYIKLADPRNPSQADRKMAATRPPVFPASSSPPVASPSSPSTPKSSFSPSSNTSQTSTPRLIKRGSSSQNSSRKSLNSYPVKVRTQPQTSADEVHQEAYYLHLYEELDTLREEIKLLKTQLSKAEANNQHSHNTDIANEQMDDIKGYDEITRRDFENSHASDVGQQRDCLINQDMIARDEKIYTLTATINELQEKEQGYKDSLERYKKQQLKYANQTEHLQGIITLLKKEKQEMQKRMEILLDDDRAHMLAEIDNMKKRLENVKAQEIHELEESWVADKANMKQQMEKLVKSLGEEKNAKEQMATQMKDLMKQLDLTKARLKVKQMGDKK